jgi:hypothetical protein
MITRAGASGSRQGTLRVDIGSAGSSSIQLLGAELETERGAVMHVNREFPYEPIRRSVFGSVPGDITGDGSVDKDDVAVLISAFGRSEGEPGYRSEADLVFDGVVDLLDLAKLGSHIR